MRNNPLRHTDPSGHFPRESVVWGGPDNRDRKFIPNIENPESLDIFVIYAFKSDPAAPDYPDAVGHAFVQLVDTDSGMSFFYGLMPGEDKFHNGIIVDQEHILTKEEWDMYERDVYGKAYLISDEMYKELTMEITRQRYMERENVLYETFTHNCLDWALALAEKASGESLPDTSHFWWSIGSDPSLFVDELIAMGGWNATEHYKYIHTVHFPTNYAQ